MLNRKMKIGDELLIGSSIRIKALAGARGSIRLGITAAREIPIEHVENVVHQLSDYRQPRKAS